MSSSWHIKCLYSSLDCYSLLQGGLSRLPIQAPHPGQTGYLVGGCVPKVLCLVLIGHPSLAGRRRGLEMELILWALAGVAVGLCLQHPAAFPLENRHPALLELLLHINRNPHRLLGMPLERYFTSQEPLCGKPPLLWDDFRRPRLRRFPESVDNLRLGRYLGCGIDGLVFKAQVRGQTEPLAVKIVRRCLCLWIPGFAST